MRTPEPMTLQMLRAVIVLCAAVLCAPLVSGAQSSPVVVRLGILPGDDNAEPYYAEDTGIFRRAGIAAQIDSTLSGGRVIAAIKAGSIDIGFSNVISVAGEIQHGTALVILAPANIYDASDPGSELVQAPSTDYRTGKDLTGKAIASPSGSGSLGALGPQAWIDQTGGDSRTVRLVTGIPLEKLPAALASHEVDAAEMIEPYKTMLLQKGEIKRLAATFNAIGTKFMGGCWIASAQWVQAHPDAARRFSASMRETAHWANAHRAATAVILTKRLGIAPSILASMSRATYGERLEPALIQPPLDIAAKYGVITPMKAEDLIAGAARL
jgi:ABC-type nitrate/sulfonate/bicarbonate transport system substrate-binding protein